LQVLQQVNFSYAAAANSILWPILSLIAFGTSLIVFRCIAWKRPHIAASPTGGSSSGPAADDSVPYSVDNRRTEFVGGMPRPPGYAEGASSEFADIGLSEKHSAAFDMGAGASIAGGPAYPAHWAAMQPPQYDDLLPTEGATAKVPMDNDDGRPYEMSAASRVATDQATTNPWASDGNVSRY
jgi:hypothetical protein